MCGIISTSVVFFPILKDKNRVGGVVVRVLTLSVVDRGFESRWEQTKDYEIGIATSLLSTPH